MTSSEEKPEPPPPAAPPAASRPTPGEGLLLVPLCGGLFYGSALLVAGWGKAALLVLPQTLGFLLPVLLWARFRGAAGRALADARPSWPSLLRGAALILGGSLSALALAGLILRVQGAPVEEKALRDAVLAVPLPWGLLVFAALPALCEESLFRGALLACLRPWGPLPACAASGALFALLHGSPLRFLPVALLGFALAAAVWVTGNFWVAVAGHALHNAVVVVAARGGAPPAEPDVAPLLAWLALGAALMAVALSRGFGGGRT